ncbi:MAG: PHP domain-containing protein [Cyanobacteria bacterium REEB459]|nr:PHP domain-containing protein [Cyanobacteria bacterium REEB459]
MPDSPSLTHRKITGEAQALSRIFESVEWTSCPRTFNFHMHTVCSDGKLTPSALMEQVIDIGLEAFAITDHHTLEGFFQAKAWLEDWRWRHPTPLQRSIHGHQAVGRVPRLFTGIEITAVLEQLEIHILGYGFYPGHAALTPYLQNYGFGKDRPAAGQVIEAIQAAGGLAVLAHPARYRLDIATTIAQVAAAGIDGVEAYYAYANPDSWQPCTRSTTVAIDLAHQYNLFTTCGTDTHGQSLLRRL